MNPRAIIYFLGALLIFLAISMLPSVAVALIYGDGDFIPLISSAAFTGIVGLIFFFPNRIEHEMTIREGFTLVTFTWLAFALFGSIPFYISGHIPSFTDAFFETMSGFTTTGATILTNVEEMPHGLLFWRSFTHWLGGMGIILLSLAILPLLGVGGMQLYKAEVPGPEHDKLSPKIKDTAKILWVVYIIISLAETILLYIGGMDVYESLCHTFGTMATGGFSTKNASIGHYNSAFIDYVIVVFMLIAGINFSLHYQAFRGNVSNYWKNPETIFFLTLIAGGTLFIGADIHLFHDYSISDAIQKSLFQTVSIITTTGYGTDDYELWGTASKVILFIFMFLGGCAGSTGGAMKIIRGLVLIKYGLNEIKRLIHPHAVLPVRIGHRTIPREIVSNIGGFFLMYMLLFIMGVLAMALLGLDFESAFGSVAATIGNIGPGLGSVGPTDNYAHIPVTGKWILSFMMLVGRLEIYPVIVMLTPTFWKK